MNEAKQHNYAEFDIEALYERAEGNGRVFQFGKLKTPVEGHEAETHALRIKTPVKDVTFLLNITDAGWLGLVAYVLNGNKNVNERWIIRRLAEIGFLGGLSERAGKEGIDPFTGYTKTDRPSLSHEDI